MPVEPDLAVVSVDVTTRAATADEARSQVATNVSRMRAALGDGGVPDDAVTTASFAIYPRYNRTDGGAELVGYVAVHSFRIEIAPDRAGDAIDLAIGNGADQVRGVQFTLTDETRSSVRQQALRDAVSTARVDAETIATAAGVSITGVRHVSTSGGSTPVIDTRVKEAAGGDETVLEPGPVIVEASVSITYTAE